MPFRTSAHARIARRPIAAALTVLALIISAPKSAVAQARPLEPSVQLAGSELHASATAPDTASTRQVERRSSRTSRLFYGALIAGTALSFHYSVDPDEGGYEDGWTTAANFPDKAVHALAGWALTSVGVDLGARPWVAAASVCAAGAAFEFSQGYVSRIDIAADCVGAAGAALWRNWRQDVDADRGR